MAKPEDFVRRNGYLDTETQMRHAETRYTKRENEARKELSGEHGEIYRIVLRLCYAKNRLNLELGDRSIKILEDNDFRKEIQQEFDATNKTRKLDLKFSNLINPNGWGIVRSVFQKLSLSENDVTAHMPVKRRKGEEVWSEISMSAEVFMSICAFCGIEITQDLRDAREKAAALRTKAVEQS